MLSGVVHEPRRLSQAIASSSDSADMVTAHFRWLARSCMMLSDPEGEQDRALAECLKDSQEAMILYKEMIKARRLAVRARPEGQTTQAAFQWLGKDGNCSHVYLTEEACAIMAADPSCAKRLHTSLLPPEPASERASLGGMDATTIVEKVLRPLLKWSSWVVLYDPYIATAVLNRGGNAGSFAYTLSMLLNEWMTARRALGAPCESFTVVSVKARDEEQRGAYLQTPLSDQASIIGEMILANCALPVRNESQEQGYLKVKMLQQQPSENKARVKDRFLHTEQFLLFLTRGFDFLGKRGANVAADCRLLPCYEKTDIALVERIEGERGATDQRSLFKE